MEITNENFFNIKYNAKKDKLELHRENVFGNMLKKYKIISFMLMFFIIFSCLNLFMIYSFVKILENV